MSPNPNINLDLNSVRKTFTDWAPWYDVTHAWTLPHRHAARLVLGVRRGNRVLDIACGTGLNFAHLHTLVGNEGRITGIDLTPAMLDIARRRIAQQQWGNMEVRAADAAQLPFPASSFDRAICTYALNIVPDYQRAIAEVARVLVPGGRFVVLDIKLSRTPAARWLRLAPLFHRLAHVCAVDLGHHIVDELRLAFAEVHVQEYLAGVYFIAAADKQ